MRERVLTPMIIGVAAVCLLLSGCGAAAVSKADLEQKIKTQLTAQVKQEPDSIECPGALEAKVGATQKCVLTEGATKLGVTVTVTSVEGSNVNFSIKVDDQPMG